MALRRVRAASIRGGVVSRHYKQCGCGRTFTRAEWLALPLICANWERLEMRDCSCGSTIAVRVSERPAAPREVSL